jgi:predicted RNase H-like nuclease (RuvC/YqgF family)
MAILGNLEQISKGFLQNIMRKFHRQLKKQILKLEEECKAEGIGRKMGKTKEDIDTPVCKILEDFFGEYEEENKNEQQLKKVHTKVKDEENRERVRSHSKNLEEQVTKAESEVSELKSETAAYSDANETLSEENESLRKRVTELEALLAEATLSSSSQE